MVKEQAVLLPASMNMQREPDLPEIVLAFDQRRVLVFGQEAVVDQVAQCARTEVTFVTQPIICRSRNPLALP